MKKIILLGVLTITLFAVKDARADSFEKLKESEDYNSVYEIAGQIVQFTNGGPVLSSESREVTINDIDFDNAVKEYLDTPLFEEEIIHYPELMDALEKSPYMLIVSIRVDGYLYEACVAKARDGSDKQTGPWGVEGVYSYEPGNLTLEEQLDASLKNSNIDKDKLEFFLVGGTAPIRQPIFLALENEKISYVIPARASAADVITDSSKTPRDDYSYENLEPSDPNGFPAYDYENIVKAAKNSLKFGNGSESGVIDIAEKPS